MLLKLWLTLYKMRAKIYFSRAYRRPNCIIGKRSEDSVNFNIRYRMRSMYIATEFHGINRLNRVIMR
jgi:hypothetical protein